MLRWLDDQTVRSLTTLTRIIVSVVITHRSWIYFSITVVRKKNPTQSVNLSGARADRAIEPKPSIAAQIQLLSVNRRLTTLFRSDLQCNRKSWNLSIYLCEEKCNCAEVIETNSFGLVILGKSVKVVRFVAAFVEIFRGCRWLEHVRSGGQCDHRAARWNQLQFIFPAKMGCLSGCRW